MELIEPTINKKTMTLDRNRLKLDMLNFRN